MLKIEPGYQSIVVGVDFDFIYIRFAIGTLMVYPCYLTKSL